MGPRVKLCDSRLRVFGGGERLLKVANGSGEERVSARGLTYWSCGIVSMLTDSYA